MGKSAVALIVSLWVIPISILVNHIVPDPYMDEIFHIPQAQQYCKGNFRSWDPMITTPPGLYFLSLAHIRTLATGLYFILAPFTGFSTCSTVVLRSTNGLLAVVCSVVVYEIISHLRPTLEERKATIVAVILALYPLHWFFTFLYYTDVASLTAVLAMYLSCLKKKYQLSALLGALAVAIRQTNIIWLIFVACTEIINITLDQTRDKVQIGDYNASIRETDEPVSSKGTPEDSFLRKRRSSRSVNLVNSDMQIVSDSSTAGPPDSGLPGEIKAIILKSWDMKWKVLVSFGPFLMVLMAFVAFLRWNGGVVLGAKDAHSVSPHFAQILYFSIFTLAMAPLHLAFRQASNIFCSFWRKRPQSILQLILSLTAAFVAVHFFSIAHPYLLADNRHYPFYLWRKVMKAHWLIKYLLVPSYVYSWISILSDLGRTRRKIWLLAYFIATVAVLVPAPLIEFRYYTIPFYFLILHSDTNDYIIWLVMGILYMALNAFTMTMFLYHPFRWDHEPGVQRFIW